MGQATRKSGVITKTGRDGKIKTNISTRGKYDVPTVSKVSKVSQNTTIVNAGPAYSSPAEIQERITGMIIKQLEEGKVPWRKGWNTAGLMPSNLVSGKPYSGINALLLGMLAEENYSSPYWLTYKQAHDMGGSVKKGEKGTYITYYRKIPKRTKETLGNPGNPGELAAEDPGTFSLLKTFVVFNADQCKDIPVPKVEKAAPVDVLAEIEKITTGWNCPPIHYKNSPKASYSPDKDEISLPPLDSFLSAKEHAYTLTHELIHSTGHASRLNRWADGVSLMFGCSNYAKEELVAEIGACMALSMVGIDIDEENSGAYVKNWLEALRNDRTLVFTAASKAGKAANLIVGVSEPEVEESLGEE
jgi:antirestriction protein ArdC